VSDQLVIECCIDRLRWQTLSKFGTLPTRLASVWPPTKFLNVKAANSSLVRARGIAILIHFDYPFTAA